MPSLCSSAADGYARESLFHQKRGKFLAIDLGKNGEEVGKAGVGNPHLFAVENVMLAVGGKLSPGAAIQRIGTGRSL